MSILNKKRERDSYTITLGHLPKGGYYYISDTLTEGNKIKIPIETSIIPEEPPLILTEIKKNLNTPIFLPSCSSWFNFDNINEIEINALPEFFCGKYPSKTKEIYKYYRNFIINLYRENPNKNLTATTCMKHLAGDGGSILRIHAFLEHWGLINFKVDPIEKPNNCYLPKAFNFKSPVYIDTSFLISKNNHINNNNNNNDNSNNKNNENNNLSTNNNLNEEKNNIEGENKKRILHPLNEHKDNIYRKYFSENPYIVNKQINFLTKNYRPKCDMCLNLCELDWYITKENPFKDLLNNNLLNDDHKKNKMLIICENCYEKGEFIYGLKKEDFEISNVYNLFSEDPINEKLKDKLENEKWSNEENKLLLEAIEKYGEGNWDEISKVFNGKKTKLDCIIHLLQFPLKENLSFTENKKEEDKEKKMEVEKNENENLNNKNNINKVIFFAKMFDKYIGNNQEEKELEKTKNLKETIYKTYVKSIIKSNELKNKEKEEMKKIMDYLIYLQMKKVEIKLNFFNDFEQLIEFHKNKFKSCESQLFQDRFKLTEQKAEIISVINQVKDASKGNHDIKNIKKDKINIEQELKLLEL